MTETIRVQNISKRYGNITALDDISFSVRKGEITGFLGPNGAGKTTTMRILTCFMPADEGSTTVLGYDTLRDASEIKKRIGYLPEHPPLYSDMTVREYLAFVCRLKDANPKSIEETAHKCAIDDVMDRLIDNLSKGYRQRVGIAQAIIHNPDLLILDEPTIGLDPNQIRLIRDLIKEIGQEKTVLLSSHTLSEVQAVCSRVLIINHGKMVAEDDMETLSKKFSMDKQGVSRVSVTCKQLPDDFETMLLSLPGVIGVERGRGATSFVVEMEDETSDELASFCLRNGWGILNITPQQVTLEEIFARLTKKDSR